MSYKFATPYGDGRTSEDSAGTLGTLLPQYLRYAGLEWGLASQTLKKYGYALSLVKRMVGDIRPGDLRKEHVLFMKAGLASRGTGPSYIKGLINGLKSFLKFCGVMGIPALDPRQLRPPRIPRREVVFLTQDEVQEFVAAIPLEQDLKWFSFRVLVEVLLGSGMRISEALSLERSSIDFATGEVRIVGKGNKERTVFFTARALHWIAKHFARRLDAGAALFTLPDGRPFRLSTVSKWFREVRERARLKKNVTAHTLRHTVATTLLFNGCPIGHIKEVLGHSYLQTTCMYYLGTDKQAAKEAHLKFLNYDLSEDRRVS